MATKTERAPGAGLKVLAGGGASSSSDGTPLVGALLILAGSAMHSLMNVVNELLICKHDLPALWAPASLGAVTAASLRKPSGSTWSR